MASFWQSLRHAFRLLRLSPGFTIISVLTLALGIGANTAIFQLIDSVRLRAIPVKNPQDLGTIRIADRHWGSGQFSSQYSQLTFPMWEQIRKRQEGFAEIAVWSDQRFNLATGGEVRKAKGIRVSGDFFHVLGVEPILGRLLGPEDDQPGCGVAGANKYLDYKLGALSASTGFSELRQDSETSLWLLLGISGLVLLIACANLANLMLARAGARERQITIRRALGASRWRMIRDLLSESLLLAVAGTICGLFLAFAISRLLVAFISTPQSQVFLDLGMDWRLLAFTTALAVLTTVSFGLAPAVRATRAEPATLLQSGSRGMSGGRERFSLRRILVVSQVALSVVLLMGALLFARSLRNLTTLNIGFQQNGILITSVDFKRLHIPEDRYVEYKRQLVKSVRAMPGVEFAANSIMVPFAGETWNDDVIAK